jgi:tetratricopeptide (TPR) repeat protein
VVAVPDLPAVCAEARPGERPPLLTESLPDAARAWLRQLVPPAANAAAARARAEAAVASWRALRAPESAGSADFMALVAAYLQLLEAAYLAESLWPAGDVQPPPELAVLLEPTYDGLRLPAVFSAGFVQQLGGVVVQMLSAADAPTDVVVALLQLARALPDRARRLHRLVAIPIACGETPADEAAALDALRHLADAARDAEDCGEALAFRREVVRRAADDVGLRYALALAAYRAGRFAEGDRAATEADALCGAECRERPRDLAEFAAASRVVAGWTAAEDAEAQIGIAGALETLGRRAEARTLYESAAEALPDDARPRTGLARMAMTESLDVETALPLLEAAGLDHRDRDYWELLVACRAMSAAYGTLPRIVRDPDRAPALFAPAVASLREAVASYLEFEPARASALLLLLDVAQREIARGISDAQDAAARALREISVGAARLAGRYPDSPEVVQLLVAAALFAPGGEEAFAALAGPVPEDLAGDAAFLVRRATLFLNAVVRWGAAERLAEVETLVAAVPATGGLALLPALLRADATAAAWRLAAEGADAAAVRERYAALVEDPSFGAEHRPRALNNLAVALAAAGEVGAAAERLRRAEELAGEDADIPAFNRLALGAMAEDLAPETIGPVVDGLRAIAGDGRAPEGLRRQAWRWVAAVAERQGRAEDAAAARAAADAVEGSPIFGDVRAADRGLMARGKFNFGLGYSSLQGLVVNLDTSAWIWLLVPAPADQNQ